MAMEIEIDSWVEGHALTLCVPTHSARRLMKAGICLGSGQGSLPLFDPICYALSDHDRRGVCIGTHHIGMTEASATQALQTVYPTILVHHRHGI
jgi:hypothetical protein